MRFPFPFFTYSSHCFFIFSKDTDCINTEISENGGGRGERRGEKREKKRKISNFSLKLKPKNFRFSSLSSHFSPSHAL